MNDEGWGSYIHGTVANSIINFGAKVLLIICKFKTKFRDIDLFYFDFIAYLLVEFRRRGHDPSIVHSWVIHCEETLSKKQINRLLFTNRWEDELSSTFWFSELNLTFSLTIFLAYVLNIIFEDSNTIKPQPDTEWVSDSVVCIAYLSKCSKLLNVL